MKHWIKALFLLPVAVVATGGGLLSMCQLLEWAGFHPHHHGDGIIHFCDDTHTHKEQTPCNGDCLLELPETDDGQSVDRVLPPVYSIAYLPDVLKDAGSPLAARPGKLVANVAKPPGYGWVVPTPQRTCRFLI